MKKIFIAFGSVMLAALLFIGGVYASEKGWLEFNGDETLNQANDDIETIMSILKQVNEGKITAEEAVVLLENDKASLENDRASLENEKTALQDRIDELQDKIDKIEEERPPGLNKKIKDLEAKVKELEAKIEELESDIVQLEGDLKNANDIIDLKDQTIAGLQEDKKTLETGLANITQERDSANEYIDHLETELERANAAVNSHANKVSDALKEAESYVSENDGE